MNGSLDNVLDNVDRGPDSEKVSANFRRKTHLAEAQASHSEPVILIGRVIAKRITVTQGLTRELPMTSSYRVGGLPFRC